MHRILLVDDDPETYAVVRLVLRDAGYTVETAPDAPTALAIIAASPPDLLITDLVMPDLTGWSVFARARRLSPTLPIIIMSELDTEVPQQERELANQAILLRKPFETDQLLAIVARLLAGIRSERDPMPAR
jgi:DNA-binding response OmpR family regulator